MYVYIFFIKIRVSWKWFRTGILLRINTNVNQTMGKLLLNLKENYKTVSYIRIKENFETRSVEVKLFLTK